MSPRVRAVFAMTAVLALVIGFSVRAQRGGERRRRNRVPENSQALESIKRLRCSFSAATSGVWEPNGSALAHQRPMSQMTRIPANTRLIERSTSGRARCARLIV